MNVISVNVRKCGMYLLCCTVFQPLLYHGEVEINHKDLTECSHIAVLPGKRRLFSSSILKIRLMQKGRKGDHIYIIPPGQMQLTDFRKYVIPRM